MSIGSTLGDAFDASMEWLTDGSLPWAMTKTVGAILIAAGIALSPFAYMAHQNELALQHRIESLDSQPTYVFNSVSGCMEKGYGRAECEASYKEAIDIAGALGTALSYSSQGECVSRHKNCEKDVTNVTTYIKSGDVLVPVNSKITSYNPYVKAWQAAQKNLQESVPLYQSSVDGMVVRSDGAQFNMP